MKRMPVLFVGHGSPMNIALDNAYTRSLRDLAGRLPVPEAVCIVSAHWMTRGTFVSCQDTPRQVFDFYGFPDELYRVRYEPPGHPARYAVPTPDHYFPMLYAAALREKGEPLRFPCEIFQNRSVSMRSFAVGETFTDTEPA